MHHTITGVDLAKEEIQVCVSKRNKVHSNQAMTNAFYPFHDVALKHVHSRLIWIPAVKRGWICTREHR